MEEKTIWQRVAGLVGARNDRGLRELRTHTRRCPAGHPIAVDWSDCPYCRAQRTATEVGQVEKAPAGPTSKPPVPPASVARTLVRGREIAPRPPAGVVFSVLYEPDTGQYRIADESDTGGTLLNGKPIDSKGSELPDEAQIRAGNTLFIFKKVPSPASSGEGPAMQEQPIVTKLREAPRVDATGRKPT
ncbi:MAG TPA: FHA domain-containing protein [Steroidobacteraceae bacterium]|nr:FHA domain-containing protein [Steroidobacteraceae bacterium]